VGCNPKKFIYIYIYIWYVSKYMSVTYVKMCCRAGYISDAVFMGCKGRHEFAHAMLRLALAYAKKPLLRGVEPWYSREDMYRIQKNVLVHLPPLRYVSNEVIDEIMSCASRMGMNLQSLLLMDPHTWALVGHVPLEVGHAIAQHMAAPCVED